MLHQPTAISEPITSTRTAVTIIADMRQYYAVMPEYPDITIYIEALRERIVGRRLDSVRVRSPFLIRTVDPPRETAEGRIVSAVSRVGKRIAMQLEGDLAIVIHLMIAGRLSWRESGAPARGRQDLAAFDFESGTLILTEAGTKRRASLHVVAGQAALHALDPGGVDVFETSATEFAAALQRENRTLKRALTDPRIISGIGNAYSDEILHAAHLSPFVRTQSLTTEQLARLHDAARDTLTRWTNTLRTQFHGRFPGVGDITAFRPDFAVHGRFGKPCPVCGTRVQRVIHAENEMNYCPTCQTDGRILADRSLSRLLRDDWPKTVEELE